MKICDHNERHGMFKRKVSNEVNYSYIEYTSFQTGNYAVSIFPVFLLFLPNRVAF